MPLLLFLTSNMNFRVGSKFQIVFFTFFLTKKVTKKSRQTLLLRFAIPPTYGVTENGSIVFIRIVRKKVEDSGLVVWRLQLRYVSSYISYSCQRFQAGRNKALGKSFIPPMSFGSVS